MSPSSPAVGSVAPSPRSRLGALFLLTTLALALTSEGVLNNLDSDLYVAQARGLVEHGSFAIPDDLVRGHVEQEVFRGPDDRFYVRYGIGTSLVYAPFCLAGLLVHEVTGMSVERADLVLCTIPNLLAGAAIATTMAWLLLAFGFSHRWAGPMGILSILCTLLWPSSKMAHVDIQQTACIFAAFAQLAVFGRTRRIRHLWLGSAFAGLAVLLKGTSIPVLLPLGVYAATMSLTREGFRPARLVALVVPAGIAAAALLLANAVKTGDPLQFGYPMPGKEGEPTATPLVALYGLTIDSDRSMFLFTPALVPALLLLPRLWRRARAECACIVAMGLATLGINVAWFQIWHAGSCYGPRYLLPIIPLLWFVLALGLADLRGMRRGLVVAVLVVSGLAQLPGVLFPYYEVEVARKAASERGWVGWPAAWSPTGPGQFEFQQRLTLVWVVGDDELRLERLGFPLKGAYASRAQFARRLPLWWIRLRSLER